MVMEEFEREKVCYEQNYLQFRSLNQIMWQVPILAMTLTGGLWFGAAKVNNIPNFQYALLLLAGISNIGLIVVLTRTRYVMQQYLDVLEKFSEAGFVKAQGETLLTKPKVVATAFRCLLGVSAFISFPGIVMIASTPSDSAVGQDTAKVECGG